MFKFIINENNNNLQYDIIWKKQRLNTIDEAIADFKEGNFVIVDDEDRKWGWFYYRSRKDNPEKVNFMMMHGRGVLCATHNRRALCRTGVGYAGYQYSLFMRPFHCDCWFVAGCTTGVLYVRSCQLLIRALADPNTKPTDLGRPNSVRIRCVPVRAVCFPCQKAGHTVLKWIPCCWQAFILLLRWIEIINEDGTMARFGQ